MVEECQQGKWVETRHRGGLIECWYSLVVPRALDRPLVVVVPEVDVVAFKKVIDEDDINLALVFEIGCFSVVDIIVEGCGSCLGVLIAGGFWRLLVLESQ